MIELVMERYARRFGKVDAKTASKFEMRLALRESGSPNATIRALNGRACFHKYPRSLQAIEATAWFDAAIASQSAYTRQAVWHEARNIYANEKARTKSREFAKYLKDQENLRECRKLLNKLERVIYETS